MGSLTRIDPFDQLFPEMLRRFTQPMRLAEDVPSDIRLDVTENEKDFQVRATIPGAKKEDIRVTVDGNFVSIMAEVKKEKEEKEEGRVLLKESYHGSVSRGFSLPSDIDSQGVVAKLEDGVLKLTLPKRADGASRTISIQ